MELVLWKPLLNSFLISQSRHLMLRTTQERAKLSMQLLALPFLKELNCSWNPRPTGLPVYNSFETAACTEEEMEPRNQFLH